MFGLLTGLIFGIWLSLSFAGDTSIHPPVKCHGPVPKISEGEYFYHDNETYQLRVTTNLKLTLDLHHRSCFQIDIDEPFNESMSAPGFESISSLFYAVKYVSFLHHYPVRSYYQFGIPEFQSFCRCDCPKADSFCTYSFDHKTCSKGEICVTKYYGNQNSNGCQHEGPASLCCEITVQPFQNRRFTAVTLDFPTPDVVLEIELYALYKNSWKPFRQYVRHILPYKGNYLHLNGYDNFVEMYIFAEAKHAQFSLQTNGDKYYYYEVTSNHLTVLTEPKINSLHEHDVHKYGWLRYKDGKWTVPEPLVSLYQVHQPIVVDCRKQIYHDHYDVNPKVKVIRNMTGAISGMPFLGYDITDHHQEYIYTAELAPPAIKESPSGITVLHKTASAPILKLDMSLHQKMSIVSHLHASYLQTFLASVCLDRHALRFLNITLIQSYGEFLIEVYKDASGRDVDLVLSMVTNLPFASNYTEILPLPSHIASGRYVCVRPTQNVKSRKHCKWALFVKEPVIWFELKNTYIETAGECPGCNVETESSFWEHLNPKNWLNGINSVPEAIAVFLETVLYFALAIAAIILIRKVLWPLFTWAACSGTVPVCAPGPKYEKCAKCQDV